MSNILFLAKASYYSLNAVIWAICIGVFLATLLSYYSKGYLGGFIRKCYKNALGESNAKTINELGYKKHFMIKYALKSGSFRRVLSVVGGSIPTAVKDGKKKPCADFENARFYISDAQAELAYAEFGQKPKFYPLILITLFLTLCAILLPIYLPYLLDILKVPYKT